MMIHRVKGTRVDRVRKVDIGRIARLASSVVAVVAAGIIATSIWMFSLGFAGMAAAAVVGNWSSYELSAWTVYAATLTAAGGQVALVMGLYLRYLLRGSASEES